ncbi:MAG: glycosyltransferase family 39 protein, partial [Anaerolineales bacterium]|nr:glycosyltransferase family 39 protein [Anaerolineales bacterium]
MTRIDKIAFVLSLIAVIAAYLVADRVFERMPHLEDEIAFVWQAQVSARGDLTVPSPPEEDSFTVGFVIDKDGRRFGKYPLGWPALLSIGLRLGLRAWVNPLLAGLGVWLTYRLVKRLTSEIVALLAAGLTLTSPFFLINSGSLLSHPFGLVLSTAFVLAWVDNFLLSRQKKNWLPTIVAGLALGCLLITRPFTAFGVALPFGLHGVYLLVRGDKQTRLRVLTV